MLQVTNIHKRWAILSPYWCCLRFWLFCLLGLCVFRLFSLGLNAVYCKFVMLFFGKFIENTNSYMRRSHCKTCFILGLNSYIIETFSLCISYFEVVSLWDSLIKERLYWKLHYWKDGNIKDLHNITPLSFQFFKYWMDTIFWISYCISQILVWDSFIVRRSVFIDLIA